MFVDEYRSKEIDAGKRSITIRFEYRSDSETLTDEEAEKSHTQVLDRLRDTFAAEFR